jgi:hypothetical protein
MTTKTTTLGKNATLSANDQRRSRQMYVVDGKFLADRWHDDIEHCIRAQGLTEEQAAEYRAICGQ